MKHSWETMEIARNSRRHAIKVSGVSSPHADIPREVSSFSQDQKAIRGLEVTGNCFWFV